MLEKKRKEQEGVGYHKLLTKKICTCTCLLIFTYDIGLVSRLVLNVFLYIYLFIKSLLISVRI